MLRKIIGLGGAIVFILTALAAHAGDSYLDNVAASAKDIADGSYDMAVDDASKALATRSDDPLAHIVLGTALLHVRQVDQAIKSFSTANNLVPGDPLALYGLGLSYLAKGDRSGARDYFTQIEASPLVDTKPAIAYLSNLWGYPTVLSAEPTDLATSEIKAEEHFARGDSAEARKLFEGITRSQKGFIENPGAVMTFDPENPLALTAPPLAKAYKSPAEPETAEKRIGGTLTLRADMANSRAISYVLFYVDDQVVAIVNHPPYECQFDTRKVSNAEHSVKIEGRDEGGSAITQKSAKIFVYNRGAAKADPATGADVQTVRAKIWESLQLRPSLRAAYYGVMKSAEKEKDSAGALAAVESLVGIDPDYRNARAELLRRYGEPPAYREVWKVKTTEKVAAITFDDGPKPSTKELLDILREKNVKATFFVVGFMAETYPDVLRQMDSEGHEIESHTYSHRNLEYISDTELEREFIRNQSAIRSIIGHTPHFFRAPGGHHNGIVAKTAAHYGLSQVMWTVNCGENEGKKPEAMVHQVNGQAVPGCVILMHNTEPSTLKALPTIIDDLRAKGFRLVTLRELLAAEQGPK